ncbi:tetratricopeptide repeat protein [Bradyrhizobium sp.]|uniref:tetratricopeptide repeat protein n=1 Tax=Bradyrhizobium sp. TaxID=376 RepID=UPI002D3C2850|nr:tetratricopeptide repeat protein [Bradyrhizobium sp.]HZR76196.1 tetratricopeptide repeat protein [Bradyrhizobium sp.]
MSHQFKSASSGTPNLARLQRQALSAFEQGHFDKAERLCAAILEYRNDDFDALNLAGFVRLQRGRHLEAIGFLTRAVKANPRSFDAVSNLGLAFHGAGRLAEAVAQYRNALALAPRHPEILYNLGNAYLAQDRIDDALTSYDEALAQKPSHTGAWVNRGNTLLRFNRPADALASYDKALATMPSHPQILTNRGHALRRLNRPQEALADFAAALSKAPEFPEAHFEMALARMTLGDFDAGWKQYEWRWKTGAFADKRRAFRQPPWLGDAPLAGKTILLHAEQGFGDTIQFIRYAPLLVERGARAICEVQPELVSLLSQFEGVEVIAKGGKLPAFDLHCPLLSLPLAFGTRLETIPAATPYLAAPASRIAHWRDRLGQRAPRAGFVWSGSTAHKNDANRSIPLARLASFFEELPLACVSLQREMREADRLVLQRLPDLTDLGAELSDFSDTAAVISLLDVVVSVDTAVAHLAGSLGKQVLILLPHAADFRWLRERHDTPWYPTAKLLRQPSFGDWDSVIAGLADEIQGHIGAGSAR